MNAENDQLKIWFRDQALILVESGVDILLLETLAAESSIIITAIEAVAEFHLPIWLAVSCAQNRNSGELYLGVEESRSYSLVDHVHIHEPFHSAVETIAAQGGYSALLMMHSAIDVTTGSGKQPVTR